MAVPDVSSGAPLMDRDPSHSNRRNSKHSNHLRRSRKHFPLSTMPHSHRGKRKLQLDLEAEWDYTDTTPWTEGASDDYSSLESNCNLPEQTPATLPNLRRLCEDFSFSLDSLNDNLITRPVSPPSTTNVTTLHCPFASTVRETLPSVSVQERLLYDKESRVNLSDYESDLEDEEDSRDYEEGLPLIIDSDCTGDEDSLHEFVTCSKYNSTSFAYQPTTSPSAIPFKQVTSVSTVSASNSFDSILTTSSNESLRTISSFSNSSVSSDFFPCPENYDMLYRNFEIAARMEESKNCENIEEQSDQTSSTLSSPFSSNMSSDSTMMMRKGEKNLSENRQSGGSGANNKVTTFAKLADSRNRSPESTTELTSFALNSKTITHWTEVLSKQCHSTKSSPESGINSPIDQSPDSPKVKRPHFLPLQLRHIQRPSAKPNTNGGDQGLGLLRTLSAPGGFDNPSKNGLSNQVQSAISTDPPALCKLNCAIEEIVESPVEERGDLISWSQTVTPPLNRSVSVNEKSTKQAPLIDWEDIFTSRQSFCELDSPVRKTKLPFFPDSTADINANFSTTSEVTAWLSRSRHLEDKGIMTSPYQFPNCSCSRSTFQNPANKLPLYTATEGALPNRSVYALPLQSVDDFSDRDSLSSLESLESLEMDDSVFRESLYSLSSEQLYQSQTFTQVTDEIYEDSLCEDVPSGRQPLFDPEPIEDTINQLDFTGSMLSSCFSQGVQRQKRDIPNYPSEVFRVEREDSSPVQAMKLDLDLSTSPMKSVADGFRKQPDNLYRLNFVSKETPVRYIKNKPLKPIHQVDAEYRCRKVLEQLHKPSQSQSTPSLYRDTRPQTVFINTSSTLGHPLVCSKVKEDGDGGVWQEDILDALPPQEMKVSPKSNERQQDLDLLTRKRDLVLTIKSAIQQVQQLFEGKAKETMETAFFDKVICQLVAKCFCPAIEGLVKDGMKPYSSSWLMGRVKNTSWIVIQATTELGPGTRALNGLFNTISEAGIQQQSSLRFNAFVMGLLNEDLLCDWLEHCRDHPNIMRKYYESLAFFNLCNSEPYAELFTELLTLLRQLSRIRFLLDYFYESKLLKEEMQAIASNEQEKTEKQTSGMGSKVVGRSILSSSGKSSDSNESRASYIDSKKLASSVWNLYGKVKNYASLNTSGSKDVEVRETDDKPPLDRRGECDGEPAGHKRVYGLDESAASDDSSETRWSVSWIQGFANTVATPSPQLTSSDDSQSTPTKTWGAMFKSSKWSSGISQMMPRKWKTSPSASEATLTAEKTSSSPPLYERHVSGCGTPITGGKDMVESQSPHRGFYSSIRTRVKTRCHYVSLNPGELSFMKGDVLTVRGQTSDEWLLCSIGPDSGLVHVDYIQELN